ncbi:MAG TPA: c-type cytochrome [Xanthomonadales bacterium]|nr:c-type cytochrome [Xanthomonadales bacterium]
MFSKSEQTNNAIMAGKLFKLLLFFSAGGLILFVSFAAYIYIASERYLGDVVAHQGFEYSAELDAETLERGRHIARTRGCFGCHGQELQGAVFSEEWGWVGTAVAPNLAKYARQHDAVTIEAAVRQGIGHDGKALWSMPSYNFVLMNDNDLTALIAFLRSAPVVEKPLPEPDIGWEARYLMASGQAQHMADWADLMPPLLLGQDDPPNLVRGEYLAKTTCNECHGFDLRGQEDFPPIPDLAIVAAYTDEDFRHLMRTGEAIGGRKDLGLMSIVAKDRFASFTHWELRDLLSYLRTLPDQPVDEDAAWRQLR